MGHSSAARHHRMTGDPSQSKYRAWGLICSRVISPITIPSHVPQILPHKISLLVTLVPKKSRADSDELILDLRNLDDLDDTTSCIVELYMILQDCCPCIRSFVF